MSKQAFALIAGLLVAGLLVVGCGGDDGNDASGASGTGTSSNGTETTTGSGSGSGDADSGDQEDTPTPTKAVLIKQADALCAEIEKSITAQGTKLFSAKEKPGAKPDFQEKVVAQVLVPEYQTMVDDIEALGVPEGDEEELAVVYDDMEQRVVVMGEDPKGFFKPDAADRAEYNELLALVKGYGFKRCYQ